MTFEQEVLAALQAGADYDTLMGLVRRHVSEGLSVDAAYEALHRIWLEHGFNQGGEGGAFQDNLEAVMEKVWYGFVA